ncbi:aminoglycoside phosphotransferase family protein [Streptomyces ficellus]|uniref:Aminoglycoside phosphotransferase family protein n=1 Tax=Streptomyces ficellus TaxID=1977088 RepID=A0ABT7Z9U7_9ACTN|nr:aminoglycoside phosphotransferase family protein [Streptomyces ficellus]MDN3296213.1 aminoglycoside phosphotransferase family protein [Streptomyces ficellus]
MIEVPAELARIQGEVNGDEGRAFIAALPGLAERFLEEWGLRRAGPVMHGWSALVLPVVAGDGTRAALKLQLRDEESEGEGAALRAWGGSGAVRLLAEDAGTATLLLEWLDEGRHLSAVEDVREATATLAGLMARLVAVPAPAGMRRLGDIAARMLDDVPEALAWLEREEDRRLLRDCAAAVREVVGEPGDRLLHWDLHFDNVLAADREPWLAIDPKPLAGDPGFELLPALFDRFDPDDVLWRFDLMTEVLGLDRERARAWTLGRVLQDSLWDVEDGVTVLEGERAVVGRLLLGR